MNKERKYLYGPVPSRRLGRSLGVDIVPAKICTLDCIYCQIGKTTNKTIERKKYLPAELIIEELSLALSQGLETDYITLAGSGEPTLNSELGKIIDEIKKITDIPVTIVTNGTLLYMKDVRDDCAKADVVLPSLDAGDEEAFLKINRPHPDISIEKLISGLCEFRKEYSGQIWLEVFLIESANSYPDQIAKIKAAIDRIQPDKVQLNTSVRPTTEENVKKLSADKLQEIANLIGPNCEVIADLTQSDNSDNKHKIASKQDEMIMETLFSMLKRRPCSLEDICSSMNMHRNVAIKYISELTKLNRIHSENIDGTKYFKAAIHIDS
ncbi:MAG: radical SAM protein [Sedimentisphaerales bacterium]|nr:radical SAM protein [Sedimentisphaerales bacterium]